MDYAAVLAQKLEELFPDAAARQAAVALLADYGTQPYEREIDRVRLAILKLCGGAPDKIREHVRMAKQDYRDILAYAEYPAEMQAPTWNMPAEATEKIRAADRKQYTDWLTPKK